MSYFYRKEVQRLEPLVKEKSITEIQFDNALAEAEEDKAELNVAKANLALVKSEPLQGEVEIIKSEIRILEQELAFYEDELERTFIKSPLTGWVISKNLDQFLGKYLKEGDLFSIVENADSVKAEIFIPEGDISLVELGDEVEIKVLSYPNNGFLGTVATISKHAEKSKDNPYTSVIRVETSIANQDGLLKSGMTGYGKIDGEKMPVGIAFTRAIVRFVMIEMWSWLP